MGEVGQSQVYKSQACDLRTCRLSFTEVKMCAIVVRKGNDLLADEVVEFRYEDGTLILKKLFSEDIRIENVRRFEWSERDDTLRILG